MIEEGFGMGEWNGRGERMLHRHFHFSQERKLLEASFRVRRERKGEKERDGGERKGVKISRIQTREKSEGLSCRRRERRF